MDIGQKGLDLIKKSEGFRDSMYYDANNLPTIGYGTLIDTNEEQYLKTEKITESKAQELLKKDCDIFEKSINNMVKVPLTQNQFDALVSLVYNIGPNNFKTSSLLGSINNKKTKEEISNNWKKWNKSGGKTLSGLVKRRQEELNLFFS